MTKEKSLHLKILLIVFLTNCVTIFSETPPSLNLLIIVNKNNSDVSRIVYTVKNWKGNINETDSHGATPILTAIEWGQKEIVLALLEKGADVDIANENGLTPLHSAVNRGDAEILKFILKSAKEINPKIQKEGFSSHTIGNTPLIHSIWCGRPEITEALLTYGADPNIPNTWGDYPINLAARLGNLKMVISLLDHNARVDVKDRFGRSPYDDALYGGNQEIVGAIKGKMK